jgi:hypothetical protein
MPTFQVTPRFERDRKQLTPESRARFQPAITGQYVPDLARGVFRAGSRVNGVQAAPGVSAMTGAPDSRATYSYRPSAASRRTRRHLAPDRHSRHLPGTLNRQPATHSNDNAPSPITATGPKRRYECVHIYWRSRLGAHR